MTHSVISDRPCPTFTPAATGLSAPGFHILENHRGDIYQAFISRDKMGSHATTSGRMRVEQHVVCLDVNDRFHPAAKVDSKLVKTQSSVSIDMAHA
ncbi:hypothetical protein IG631_03467 [Alternaria alternata]|nr:hypothetical protein IG631_03467 [Alternaria alternata]